MPGRALREGPPGGAILGIDPGTRRAGYAVVVADGRPEAVGTIRPRGAQPHDRLADLQRAVEGIIARYRPSLVALERAFLGANPASALRVGEARGAVMAAVAARGLPLREYAPARVKMAVTGRGGATKMQVQRMVARLAGLRLPPQEDAADALAVALCARKDLVRARRLGERAVVRRAAPSSAWRVVLP